MAWCKPLLRLTTTLLLMEIFTAASENVTEGSVFAPTTELWPSEPDCLTEPQPWVCACDALCTQYGDCCRSSPYFRPEEQRLGASPFTCNKGFYVIANCPKDWPDDDTRRRCEHPETEPSDPLLDAPVTTNITYRNWHCAACHSDTDETTAVIWNAEFNCRPEPPVNVSDDDIVRHISYDMATKEWILNINELSMTCKLVHIQPYTKYNVLRTCHVNVVSDCADDWTDQNTEHLCHAYTALETCGWDTYRNPHCFICNGFRFPRDCSKFSIYTPPLPSLSLLLDWKRLKKSMCAKKEIYDPISSKCRKVYT
ncbi:uncharacterized protein [Periplaneta americana]|uniref:uncharacterized protein isoform X4 n=1 Tax=Periplaneta americana TaxID=6978 RepID=UPI0037E787BA